jgi:hypothetical protein
MIMIAGISGIEKTRTPTNQADQDLGYKTGAVVGIAVASALTGAAFLWGATALFGAPSAPIGVDFNSKKDLEEAKLRSDFGRFDTESMKEACIKAVENFKLSGPNVVILPALRPRLDLTKSLAEEAAAAARQQNSRLVETPSQPPIAVAPRIVTPGVK